MSILPFLLMTELQAARFREITSGDINRLDPRLVTGGEHIGKYVLPRRVMDDTAFVANTAAFLMLEEIVLDLDVAFPPPPEEEEV